MAESTARVIPAHLSLIVSGEIYSLPRDLRLSNQQLLVSRVGEMMAKTPSSQGWHFYVGAFQRYENDGLDRFVRQIEARERFGAFDELAKEAAELSRNEGQYGKSNIHYLLVHWLQHERLRISGAVHIPEVRFAAALRKRFLRSPKLVPLMLQEFVQGTVLWEMWDEATNELRPEWVPYRARIAAQLEPLLQGSIASHIDFNIKNFILRGDGTLAYVDLKPTVCLVAERNEQNKAAMLWHFLNKRS